jgi:arylamine N-acetyltransferase
MRDYTMSEQEFERQERIGDDWITSARDYLEPIAYADEAMANKFSRTHCCAVCMAQLTYKRDYLSDGYVVICEEHGEITKSNTVTNQQAQLALDSARMGSIEMNAAGKPKRSEAEILSELGF